MIEGIARSIGKLAAQIAINWCLCKDGVVAIPKGDSEGPVLENHGASDWRLSAEQVCLLDEKIQYRNRSRFDALARRWIPNRMRPLALRAVGWLPRGLRRRVS